MRVLHVVGRGEDLESHVVEGILHVDVPAEIGLGRRAPRSPLRFLSRNGKDHFCGLGLQRRFRGDQRRCLRIGVCRIPRTDHAVMGIGRLGIVVGTVFRILLDPVFVDHGPRHAPVSRPVEVHVGSLSLRHVQISGLPVLFDQLQIVRLSVEQHFLVEERFPHPYDLQGPVPVAFGDLHDRRLRDHDLLHGLKRFAHVEMDLRVERFEDVGERRSEEHHMRVERVAYRLIEKYRRSGDHLESAVHGRAGHILGPPEKDLLRAQPVLAAFLCRKFIKQVFELLLHSIFPPFICCP